MPILSAVWIILLAASVPFNTNAFSADNIRTTMPERMLNPVSHADVSLEIKDPVDETALGQAKAIIAELRSNANGPVDASKHKLHVVECYPLIAVGSELLRFRHATPQEISDF